MKTIPYALLSYFLLFNLVTSPLYAYAHEVEQPEASPEALLESTPEASIQTGAAVSELTEETEINRNVVGENNCFVLLNVYKNPDSTVDLANIIPTGCSNQKEATPEVELDINNINDASIQQHISATADTGNNISAASIETGDATTSAYISNLANTNVTGSNTLFGVVNIFSPINQNIVLPYELSFLQAGNTSPLPVLSVTNTNNTSIQNNINAYATTGKNNGGAVQTGNATILIRVADTTNTNILQSGFFMLHLNVLAPWNGTIQNFSGNTLQNPTDTLSNQSAAPTISNTNTTNIENNLDLHANTGENSSSQGAISTGNATIKAFISNIANTNIVGNNWYHMIVNIFDRFDGNIIFPRPDLVTATFSKTVGENEVDVVIRYANAGTYEAHGVQILTHLPSNAKLLSDENGGQIDGPRVYWNIDTLGRNQTGEHTLRLAFPIPGVYTISTSISTNTDEPNKGNNGSQTTITVEAPPLVTPIIQVQKPTQTGSTRPTLLYVPSYRTFTPKKLSKLQVYELICIESNIKGMFQNRRPIIQTSFSTFPPTIALYGTIFMIKARVAQLARALH